MKGEGEFPLRAALRPQHDDTVCFWLLSTGKVDSGEALEGITAKGTIC